MAKPRENKHFHKPPTAQHATPGPAMPGHAVPENVGLPQNGLAGVTPAVLAATAALLTLALYARSAAFDFVDLDDTLYVTQNPMVLAGLTLDGLRWAFSLGSANYWHPLTWVSLMLDRSLYGDWAGGFHLTNAALHSANAALLFGLVLRWTGLKWPAFAVALLFGLHPAHVESVAWVTERKDVLFLFFGLLCLHGYTSHTNTPDRAGRKALLASLLCYALSLAAKPMLVTLPALLLVLDFWPLGRLSAPNAPGGPEGPGLSALLAEKLPFLLLAAGAAATTLLSHPAGYDSFNPDLGLKLANAVASYLDYLRLLVWPVELGAFYPYPQAVPSLKLGLALLVLGALTALALRLARSQPHLLTGWLWFLGTLAPVLIPPEVGMHVAYADRWTYLPFIGLYLALALGAHRGLQTLAREQAPRRAALAGFAALAVLLSALSFQQLGWWRNATTLYERTLAVTQNNYYIMNNYGVLKMRAGNPAAAEEWLRKSLAVRPSYGKALGNMGILLSGQGLYEQAMPFFSSALVEDVREGGEAYEDHYGLGYCLARLNRLDEAESHYLQALDYKADYPQAHNDLGNIALLRGQASRAEAHYAKAVDLDPNYAVARDNLARARAMLAAQR